MRHLIQAGQNGVRAGDLAAFANVNAPTASAQLLVLSNAGLVTSTRKGRNIVYSANYEQLKNLLTFLMFDCCAGHCDILPDLQVQASC